MSGEYTFFWLIDTTIFATYSFSRRTRSLYCISFIGALVLVRRLLLLKHLPKSQDLNTNAFGVKDFNIQI